MIDAHGTTKEDRGLMLAATAMAVMQERYRLPQAEMRIVIGLALQVFLLRELPDDDPRGREARQIVLEAMHNFSGLVADIDDLRERRTTQ